MRIVAPSIRRRGAGQALAISALARSQVRRSAGAARTARVRLYISVEMADHLVSAVLAKLGAPGRLAVVVQAGTLGLS
jgi:hypothetical protein